MAVSRKDQARALNAEEKELVEKTQHPHLQEVSDEELTQLAKLIRERRKKARDQANQRRREMRGKSAARGATASKADEGSHLKVAVLATAVARINGEVERREQMAAASDLIANAQKALAAKLASEKAAKTFNTRHAHFGMRNIPNEKYSTFTRLADRGRNRKTAGVKQAKKDAR
ncbi:hypothetical protein ACFSE0_13655 [Ochrobactrum teleogrylli]|uniref:Uncharacterized protein n=1 Tax=Ochrobactrum teleogrylli TaxID=2479765 RepID=A0ABY2Y6Q9_9HYPH|nr:hypothetical protein [[Ochrobactrum] teleogrylli]TNV16044.1 hypothetical protein FIC94_12325 [[Ochrobactrum] teleogrylli]